MQAFQQHVKVKSVTVRIAAAGIDADAVVIAELLTTNRPILAHRSLIRMRRFVRTTLVTIRIKQNRTMTLVRDLSPASVPLPRSPLSAAISGLQNIGSQKRLKDPRQQATTPQMTKSMETTTGRMGVRAIPLQHQICPPRVDVAIVVEVADEAVAATRAAAKVPDLARMLVARMDRGLADRTQAALLTAGQGQMDRRKCHDQSCRIG